jgi:1,4-dihydroxy-2-naphthoyl-CoA hydrolase
MDGATPGRDRPLMADADLTAFAHQTMPFMAVIGAEALEASPELVRARVAWEPTRCTTGGLLHGGLLMALADGVGGWCAFLNLPEGAAGTTTIESKTNFLRAVRDGHVEASARPLHAGRTIIVIDTELRDDAGRLVARVTQSQAVLS